MYQSPHLQVLLLPIMEILVLVHYIKWGGLHDGRYQNSELLHLILTDERFGGVKGRILNTDVMVIDEISMVSNRTLSQVEFICRKVRIDISTCVSGNIQVILCGDFLQLVASCSE